jgi:paraquat-inducible protein A
MIDIFMISILVALVRFNQFAQINAQTGAPCFAAVVVLTMFAVITFDPRLMWDVRRTPAPVPPIATTTPAVAAAARAKDAHA